MLSSFTPAKQFSCVQFSLPELVVGRSYTIVIGSDEYSVTLDSVSYSNSTGMFGGGRVDKGHMQKPESGQTPPDGFTGETPPESFTGGRGARPAASAVLPSRR